MWHLFIFSLSSVFALSFGAPQLIGRQNYYASQLYQPAINPSDQFVYLYPQYQLVIPRDEEGGDGGGFWQSIVNYFGCNEGGSKLNRALIPPTIDTKIPERDAEKQGTKDKENPTEPQISKPFYFVIPPNPNQYLLNRLQGRFIGQPNPVQNVALNNQVDLRGEALTASILTDTKTKSNDVQSKNVN